MKIDNIFGVAVRRNKAVKVAENKKTIEINYTENKNYKCCLTVNDLDNYLQDNETLD